MQFLVFTPPVYCICLSFLWKMKSMNAYQEPQMSEYIRVEAGWEPFSCMD